MSPRDISQEQPDTNSPQSSRRHRWRSYTASGGTVVGVAVAAAFTSYAADKQVGIAAWVAVAVVGASTMISTAKNAHSPNKT